jgi:DNA-binding NarL/FixJ family response regulator
MNILIVDDDALIRRAVHAALMRLDDITPVVEFAEDGEAALAMMAGEVPATSS